MMFAKVITLVYVLVCLHGVASSHEVDEPGTCVYNDVTYKINTKFAAELCVQGCCNENGDIHLDPTCCEYNSNTYMLNSTFQEEKCKLGYCDPSGNVAITPLCCEYENETYELGSEFKPSPCMFGNCGDDGEVGIAIMICARPMCPDPIFEEGICCPKCPDDCEPTCFFEGEIYEVGPILTNNPCQYCECLPTGGEPMCAWATCAPCQSGYAPGRPQPGQCCPECQPQEPSCEFNGEIYEVGPILTNNPCQYCECPPTGGEPMCAWADCFPCLNGYARGKPKPGQCCSECQPQEPSCKYNGQTYEVGHIPSDNPCEDCECPPEGGKVMCYRGTCAPCPSNSVPINVDGECCQQCQPQKPTCEDNGQIYQVGHIETNDPCEECECPPEGGNVMCVMASCAPCPSGYEPIPRQSGQCCQECQPKEPTCEDNGQIYQVGHIETNDPCEECECPPEGGNVMCVMASCPSCPSGYEPIPRQSGQCCNQCQPKEPTCEDNGQTYKPGDIPTNDPCTTCYCPPNGGDIMCEEQSCPDCPYGFQPYISGQCCQECQTVPTCEYNGQTYQVGQIPTKDPCLDCSCPPEGGKYQCRQYSCPYCRNEDKIMPKPGVCCPGCRQRTMP